MNHDDLPEHDEQPVRVFPLAVAGLCWAVATAVLAGLYSVPLWAAIVIPPVVMLAVALLFAALMME